MAAKQTILGAVVKIFCALVVFISQIAISNILHSPFNKINLLILLMMALLIFSVTDKFFSYLIGLLLLTELFRVTPFGTVTLSAILSMFALEWILNTVLTNRFFLTVFLAGVAGVASYRIIFIILLYIWHLVAGTTFEMGVATLYGYGLEIAVNAVALTLVYLILLPFAKRMNPRYVISDI